MNMLNIPRSYPSFNEKMYVANYDTIKNSKRPRMASLQIL